MENEAKKTKILITTAYRQGRKGRTVAALFAVFLLFTFLTGRFLSAVRESFSAEAAAYDDVTPVPGEIVDDGGSAAGLPEGITILDSDGVSVDPEGDYWFWVEDMNPGETYTKTMSLMNLRDDGKKYRMYFYIEPRELVDKGIDLLANCSQQLYLEGDEIYDGNVWGDGNVAISRSNPVDLGVFETGKTKSFRCSITWNGVIGSEDKNVVIDNGHRLIDENTVNDRDSQYIKKPAGVNRAYGAVYFHWVFYAELIEEKPDDDGGNSIIDIIERIVKTGDSFTLGIWLTCIAASIVLFILILRKKKKDDEEDKKSADDKNEKSV